MCMYFINNLGKVIAKKLMIETPKLKELVQT